LLPGARCGDHRIDKGLVRARGKRANELLHGRAAAVLRLCERNGKRERQKNANTIVELTFRDLVGRLTLVIERDAFDLQHPAGLGQRFDPLRQHCTCEDHRHSIARACDVERAAQCFHPLPDPPAVAIAKISCRRIDQEH
jgi:hypothetical protein